MPKSFTEGFMTFLSARAKQAACKQAAGIVKGTLGEARNLSKLARFHRKKGNLKYSEKLEKRAANKKMSKPLLKTIEAQLDNRFFRIEKGLNTFDLWLVLGSTGLSRVSLPIKKHAHFNSLAAQGTIMNSIRLSKKGVTFCFAVQKPDKADGKTLGVDIGANSTLSLSDGTQIGLNLDALCEKLSRRDKGSKGFRRSQKERENYIRQAVNSLDLSGVKILRVEDIKHLRRGKATTRKLSHWSYRVLLNALEAKALREGVLLEKVNPAFTSQRCSQCGWVRKGNRSGERFKCCACSHEQNADLNAATNISLYLGRLPQNASAASKSGFYWPRNNEPIVRCARKA